MNRRTVLKGVGVGIGAICAVGAANFYYALLEFRRRKPLIIGGAPVVKRMRDTRLIETFLKYSPEADLLIAGGYSHRGSSRIQRE